jgi:acetyl esterase/lipase
MGREPRVDVVRGHTAGRACPGAARSVSRSCRAVPAAGSQPAARAIRLIAALAASAALLGASTAHAQPTAQYGPSEVEHATIFPSALPSSPTVLFVHGGWWGSQPNYTEDEKPMLYLQSQGITVVDIDYPQVKPEELYYPFPGEDEAVERALVWTHAHASQYRGDPTNVVLFGSSAGADIVAMVADRVAAREPGSIRGVIALSPPGTNFSSFVPELINEEAAVSGKQPVNRALACHGLTTCTEAAEREWSPALHVPFACPPWFIAYGAEYDLLGFPQQARELYEHTVAAGCESELVVAPKGHAIAYFGAVRERAVAFIRAH